MSPSRTSSALTTRSPSAVSRRAVRGVSLTVDSGERFCILGPNGCGKTTLLRLLTGELAPDSGAVEIGRLDYLRRQGRELLGDPEEVKADYAAQGQAILMQEYRRCIRPEYSVRQLLVEHTHFNDEERSAHIRSFLLRCAAQNAIPIVNYNDSVSVEEVRKMELAHARAHGAHAFECVDNDETAAVICSLVHARYLVLLTSVDGIYRDPADPGTLVPAVEGADAQEVLDGLAELQKSCVGASRAGANGARAKLAFAMRAVEHGTNVIIGHARYHITDLLAGRVPCTRLGVNVEKQP